MYVAGIDAFLAIIQTKNLKKAAELLNLTQATVPTNLAFSCLTRSPISVCMFLCNHSAITFSFALNFFLLVFLLTR